MYITTKGSNWKEYQHTSLRLQLTISYSPDRALKDSLRRTESSAPTGAVVILAMR